MSKVLTFSRQFPAYHPKAGQPTFFVEKIIEYIWDNTDNDIYNNVPEAIYHLNPNLPEKILDEFLDCLFDNIRLWKSHTIRAGSRFKVGDKFSPRVWSGKPYRSKQVIIAPDIEVMKTWEIYIEQIKENDGDIGLLFWINGAMQNMPIDIAKNDGLERNDFVDWFTLSADFKKRKVFTGQIICWNEKINY
jgi:hypothetical protein